MNFDIYMEFTGIPLDNLECKDGDPRGDIFCHSIVCRTFGWWVLDKRVMISAKVWQVWELIFATAGRLKNLDKDDLQIPIQEIRNYLSARYDSRFSINYRKSEETVSSVFRDIGFLVKLLHTQKPVGQM